MENVCVSVKGSSARSTFSDSRSCHGRVRTTEGSYATAESMLAKESCAVAESLLMGDSYTMAKSLLERQLCYGKVQSTLGKDSCTVTKSILLLVKDSCTVARSFTSQRAVLWQGPC